MLFLALAVGLTFSAADDDDEWRSKDARKTAPVRPLADDWDEESNQPKRTAKTIRPSLRKIGATQKTDDFEKPDEKKSEKWRPPAAKTASSKAKAVKKAPSTDKPVVQVDGAVEVEGETELPLIVPSKRPLKVASFEEPQESKDGSATKLPELPAGLKSPPPTKPPKVVEVGPNETPAKAADVPAPKLIQRQSPSVLPTLPKVGSATPMPPAKTALPSELKSADPPPAKKLETAPSPTTQKPIAAPIPQPMMKQAPNAGPSPLIPAPNETTKLAPVPQVSILTPPPTMIPPPGTTGASPPVLMEHGTSDEGAIDFCMPLMDAASVWRAETRTFLLWWDQPGTHSFVRDSVTDAPIVGGVDYDFEKRFAQELSIERRFDAASAMVVRGFVTEDARQGVGAVAFNGLDLGIDGPGSAPFRNFSGFSGRATSRIWKVDLDFVQHYLDRPDSPVRGRFFFGPQFIGLKETFNYRAEGGSGVAEFDARTINTLFGADAGFGVTFQPWYSNLGIDVSGRYGLFGNVFDVRNSLVGPAGSFFGAGEDGTSRFATAAELNVEATLRIARNACLLAGWRLWNIQGVGRAVDQVPTGAGSTVLANSSNNNLFAHGLFIGATLGWGGSADPNSRYGGSRPYILRQAQ
jgi:hypothetical protein